jgi:hypothetical protein
MEKILKILLIATFALISLAVVYHFALTLPEQQAACKSRGGHPVYIRGNNAYTCFTKDTVIDIQ